MQPRKGLLAALPVELLYAIHFIAASEALPLTCRRLHNVFKNASPAVHADYLIARHAALRRTRTPSIITYVLRFPLCTPSVLGALLARPSFPHPHPHTAPSTNTTSTDTHAKAKANLLTRPSEGPPELPKRLFKHLSPSGAEALPLLRFLYTSSPTSSSGSGTGVRLRPDPNSHDGYPLAHAVSAGAVPLVRFLLDHGASPCRRNALAVRIAIMRGDLALVRLLVEPPDGHGGQADRVQVTSEMLKIAVTSGAHDVAEYLMSEKGCVPDLKTLSRLSVMRSTKV